VSQDQGDTHGTDMVVIDLHDNDTPLVDTTPPAPATPMHDAATQARLDAIDEASDAHAADQRPTNTVRSYQADWKSWLLYTKALQIPETAATRGTLRGFVHWLWHDRGYADSTVDHRIAGVTVTLRRAPHKVVVDPEDAATARELLKDYVRQWAESGHPPRGRGKAPAMRLAALRRICASFPADLRGIHDRAVVLTGFAIGGRRSELAALKVRHFIPDPDDMGMVVDVTVSKTDPRKVSVPYGSNPDTCPVRAVRAWIEASGRGPDDYVFARIHHTGAVLHGGLTPQSIGAVITKAGTRAGVEIRFTGHSVRRGVVTEARRAGKDSKAIAKITGHRPNSRVMHGYMEEADQWDEQDNGLMGIGL